MGRNQGKVSSSTTKKQSKNNVLALFQDATKNDGSLDHRSTWGRAIRSIKESLKGNSYETARAVLEDQIATLLVLDKAVQQYILQNPKVIFKGGELNPMIKNDLIRFQQHARAALSLLQDLERKNKNKKTNKNNRDLNDISFD